jgi:hypothetical protein
MNPYEVTQRVIYQGNLVVITGRHPHGVSWRYSGHRADLAGGEVHFVHEDVASPEHTIADSRADEAAIDYSKAPVAAEPVRFDLERARLEREAQARATSALVDLLDVVREVASQYEIPELHEAWNTYVGSR